MSLMNEPAAVLDCVDDPERASVLLDPLRLRILREACSVSSATAIAQRLELPRQRVNYHVRQLAAAGFLEDAGQRRKGNLIEQLWRATARSYLLVPDVLGPLAVDRRQIEDRRSAAYLLALTGQVQSEMAQVEAEASARGKRVPTLSMSGELRFESAEQRSSFARALRAAVAQVVEDFASPFRAEGGGAAPGRPYRLILGCYPVPPEAEAAALRGEGGEPGFDDHISTDIESDRESEEGDG